MRSQGKDVSLLLVIFQFFVQVPLLDASYRDQFIDQYDDGMYYFVTSFITYLFINYSMCKITVKTEKGNSQGSCLFHKNFPITGKLKIYK